MYQDTYMSNDSSMQLVYSLDGLPLSPMGLTPASVEQLHRLGISTLEQLASISLISLASERNAISDMIQQDLRARLWPAIVYCYALLAGQDGEQAQLVIESDLFHFIASVVSPEEHKYTCSYRWLQAEFEENIPFHKLKQTNGTRRSKTVSEKGPSYQALPIAKQTSVIVTMPLETTADPVETPELRNDSIEPAALTTDSAMLPVQQPYVPPDIPPAVAMLPIRHLSLSTRTNNMLGRLKIDTIGQLAEQSDEALLKLKNFGVSSLQEVRQALLNASEGMLLEDITHQEHQLLSAEFPALLSHLDEIKDYPVHFLNLSIRTSNALWFANVYTLGDLLQLSKPAILELRNMGSKSIGEIEVVLQSIDSMEVQQALEKLREQGRTPLNISLMCLGLPNPASYRKLRAYGIEHFEHLCGYTASELSDRGLQSADIASIVATLRAYNLALRNSLRVTDTMPDQMSDLNIVSDETTIEQQPVSVANRIYRILTQIDQRQSEVLRSRYGLDGQSVRTLEEVGQQIGVTRERVRQIEKKALKKLQHPHHQRHIKPLISRLEQMLRSANGVISLQAARETLSLQTGESTPISDGHMTFILLFAHQIKVIKDIPIIILNCEPYTAYMPAVSSICATLKRVIGSAFAPLPLAEVLTKFASDKDGKTAGLHIPDDFIVACLKAHPDIIIDENDTYGLKQWANTRLDDIIIVMRQEGKPMHFTEIAAQINRRLPPDQQATPHNVHAHIGRLPHLFVRVGRGLFGLAEWGLVQESNSTDTAYRILCETGHALDIEVLTDRVLETWHVQRTSVRAGIDLDPRFVKVSRGRYWLAETTSSNSKSTPADDFDTLFGDVLLRRREELEQDRVTSSQHDALEDARRLGTSIFD